MLIVEQGKVVDVCAEPGEYTYDMSTEPSIFSGDLGDSVKSVFQNIGKRFTFGSEAPKDQRIYYFNTKELTGNKYGTPSPVPFRVVDQRAGIDLDIGIRYSALPGHTLELADALNEQLSGKWRDLRGMEIVSFGVSSVKANEEDEQMIKELQRNAAFMDPTRAAAHLVGSQGEAMKAAAANTGAGPAMAFMGMGMAGQAGGMNAQSLFQMGQQQQQMQQAAQPAPAPTVQGWTCSCGQSGITGNFCPNCGSKKPEPKPAGDSWKCSCGATVSGKFCPECGSPKPVPADEGWKCSCGAVNKGKFCSECGAKKPAGVPQYKCDKCGWEPADPKHLPGFLADKYDVSVEESHERADERCMGTLDAALRGSVKGDMTPASVKPAVRIWCAARCIMRSCLCGCSIPDGGARTSSLP